MTIDRRKNPFLGKTKTTTKTTAHTTSTASFMALALAVVGIIMMTNLVFPGGGSLSAYAEQVQRLKASEHPSILHT